MLATQSKEKEARKKRASAFKADRITSERIRYEFITVPIYYSDLPNELTVRVRIQHCQPESVMNCGRTRILY
ncbi:hypothetical protein TNCV_1819531 [Trichonephila clavipes]|nr:hypothetical protein TNCV_1819531 [Trichonephila clavipes]